MSTRHSKKTAGRGKKPLSATQGKDKATLGGNSETSLSEDERRRMVAEAAYYRAQQRGFTAGGEVDDWLAAEREITQRFEASGAPPHSREKTGAPPSAKRGGADMRTRPAQ